MRKTFISILTICSIFVGSYGTSLAALPNITLNTGASTVIHQNNIERIAVGDPTVLGVLPLPGKRDLLLNGRLAGRTTLFVWSKGVEHDYQVTVVADSLQLLSRMLKSTLARNDVQVETFGRSIVVRGSVSDGAAVQQISDVIAKFDPVAKDDKATIVNAVTIQRPTTGLMSGNDPKMAGIRVDPDGQGNVIVTGSVKDEVQRQGVLKNAAVLAGSYLSAKGSLIDRLSVATTTQVTTKVEVVEVDDTGLSQLGVRLQAGNVTVDANGNKSTVYGAPQFPLNENISKPFNPFQLGSFFRTTILAPTLDAIIQTGHGKIVSAPDLTTIPGQSASLLVGGQIPVPQSSGLGQVSIVYTNYGVQLEVTPTVQDNGNVMSKISPTVSDLDFQNGVQVNGFQIPALTVNKLSTTVITAPGESIVMGGMLRKVEQRTIQKIPFLSNLPLIGKIFQDVRYQHGETHIVFVMTPYIVTK